MASTTLHRSAQDTDGSAPLGWADELAALVVRARGGDQRAWRALHPRLQRMILAVARRRYRILGADAEDVAQATWARIVVGIDRLEDPRSLAAWVSTITARECLRHLGAGARRELPVDDWRIERPDLDDDPADLAARRDGASRVARAVPALTPWSQTVVRLVADPTEPSNRCIADRLGVPQGSVSFHKRRALDELRRHLDHDTPEAS